MSKHVIYSYQYLGKFYTLRYYHNAYDTKTKYDYTPHLQHVRVLFRPQILFMHFLGFLEQTKEFFLHVTAQFVVVDGY
jgi:hypothetical protein